MSLTQEFAERPGGGIEVLIDGRILGELYQLLIGKTFPIFGQHTDTFQMPGAHADAGRLHRHQQSRLVGRPLGVVDDGLALFKDNLQQPGLARLGSVRHSGILNTHDVVRRVAFYPDTRFGQTNALLFKKENSLVRIRMRKAQFESIASRRKLFNCTCPLYIPAPAETFSMQPMQSSLTKAPSREVIL